MKPKREYEIRKDCFAWNPERHECNALLRLLCTQRKNCPFYKPLKQYLDEVEIYGGPEETAYDKKKRKMEENNERRSKVDG